MSGQFRVAGVVSLVLILGAACGQSDEQKLQAVREQVQAKSGKDAELVPLGSVSNMLLPELKQKAKANPDSFELQYELASRALQAGELPFALQAARRAVELRPESNQAKELLAQGLQTAGQADQAAGLWMELVASGRPYSPLTDSNLGNFYKSKGRFDEAERHYRKALDSVEEPGQRQLIEVNLADLYLRQDRNDEASSLLRAALESAPEMPYAHLLLGRMAFTGGDMTKAASELEREIAIRPDSWEAYYLLGLSHGRMQPPQLERAAQDFQRLEALRPGEGPYFRAILADLHVDGGDPARGKALAEEALAGLPVFREDLRNAAYHALAKALHKLGDEAQAREYAQKFRQSVAQTNPNDPEQRRRNREIEELFGRG
jgi:predicted Zn-dependent protease